MTVFWFDENTKKKNKNCHQNASRMPLQETLFNNRIETERQSDLNLNNNILYRFVLHYSEIPFHICCTAHFFCSVFKWKPWCHYWFISAWLQMNIGMLITWKTFRCVAFIAHKVCARLHYTCSDTERFLYSFDPVASHTAHFEFKFAS